MDQKSGAHERNPEFAEFVARLKRIKLLGSAQGIIEYDMEVSMPPGGAEARGEVAAELAGLEHEMTTSAEFRRKAERMMSLAHRGQLDPFEATVVRRACKEIEREAKLPKELVEELAAVTSEAHHVWAAAKGISDFTSFLPHLKRIIALKRQEAAAVGFRASPYDALLDGYEPGMTCASVEAMFTPLTAFLKDFIRRLASGTPPDESRAKIRAPLVIQQRVCRKVAEAMGFDFSRGRLDASAHPFTNRLHPGDTRITTRYDENDLLSAVYSTVHETGHALYEAGMPQEQFGTCAGESASFGIHESQSRLWENMIGRSAGFCFFLIYDILRHEGLPIGHPYDFRPHDMFCAVNVCRPSLIRTEADEVTYNLHLALRFELERALIEGTIEAKDLPRLWNAKMEEYLGVTVPDDGHGVLQDVHWSAGYFGYFPTYTLGNLYAAQLFEAARRDLPLVGEKSFSGDFADLRDWLRAKVWRHGAMLDPADLITQATGEPPSAEPFKRYLETKFKLVYRL
jgi:carboxypeptidase Taq